MHDDKLFVYFQVKPEAPLLTLDRDDLDESQAVTLTCSSVNGNPPPHYTWSRNGTLLMYETRAMIQR